MGSSKIIFVGAVAVIIGLFGFGTKKAEKQSAAIAEAHAYKLNAKTLAEQGLQLAVKKLPRNINDVVETHDDLSAASGTYGYSYLVSNLLAKQVRVTSYGISNVQRVTVTSVVEILPPGPKPSGVKAWNGWKLVSSIKTFSTIDQ